MDLVMVCQGPLPFASTREGALYRAYGRTCTMLYIEPDPSPWSVGGLRDFVRRVKAVPAGPGSTSIVLPAVLPGNRFGVVHALNRWLGLWLLLSTLRKSRKCDVVLVLQQPDQLPTMRGLPATLRVYEVVDNYPALAPDPASARRIARAHAKRLEECDLVWATAKTLADDLRCTDATVVETSNGVDYALFARRVPEPPELASVPHPRVGLVGNLNDRVDWPLIETVCRTMPAWQVVLAGPIYEASDETRIAIARCSQYPNVHRLPGVPEARLPEYVHGLDVCLIPYRLNAATLHINPLKLYQYLAAGKAVVATRLPAVGAFGDVVACAATAEEFVDAIRQAIDGLNDEVARQARTRRAQEYDWARVAEQRLAVLTRRLLHAEARDERPLLEAQV